MAKIKAKENKAAEVETKPNQTVEQMSGEELALLLQQQYNTIIQTQQNIQIINAELQKRQK